MATRAIDVRRPVHACDQEEDQPRLFPLEGVLPPGYALVVGTTTFIVSLVSTAASGGNPIVRLRVLTEPELRVLLPLLEWPSYCPYEILRASRTCGLEVLLSGLFAPLVRRGEWQRCIREQVAILERAREQGQWKKALRDVYYALSDLRGKLRAFGLEVALAGEGYGLVALARPSPLDARAVAQITEQGVSVVNCAPRRGSARARDGRSRTYPVGAWSCGAVGADPPGR